jgi:hypothetical protein
MVVGVSSIMYTVKSSPKDFAILGLLLLLGDNLPSHYLSSGAFSIGSIVSVGLGINSFATLGKE